MGRADRPRYTDRSGPTCSSGVHRRAVVAGVLGDAPCQIQTFEGEFHCRSATSGVGGTEPFGDGIEHRQFGEFVEQHLRGDSLTGDHRLALLDGGDERPEIDARESRAGRFGRRAPEEMIEDLEFPSLLAGFELDLASEHLHDGAEIDGTRDRIVLAENRTAMQGRGRDGLGAGDGEPCRDTRTLVDGRRFAQQPGEPCQDLEQIVGDAGLQMRLLLDDGDLVLESRRVVRADLRSEAVLSGVMMRPRFV